MRKDYLITYDYRETNNLFEALLDAKTESFRFNNITEESVKMFVKGIKIGLGDRLIGNIIVGEVK